MARIWTRTRMARAREAEGHAGAWLSGLRGSLQSRVGRLQPWRMTSSALKGNALVTALVPLFVGFLLLILIGLLRDRIALQRRYVVSAAMVDIGQMPEGLEARAKAVLGDGRLLDRPRSILDPELPIIATAVLEARPWVKKVLSARRRFPNTLELVVLVRIPLGVVCIGTERLLVDDESVVLEHGTDLGPPIFPEVRSLSAPIKRVPLDGQRFARSAMEPGHEAIVEALAVLKELRALSLESSAHAAFDFARVVEVRVGEAQKSRKGGDSDLVLKLDIGVLVEWGRSSVSPLASLEPDTRAKLDHLLLAYRKFPGLVGVAAVDVRLDQPEVTLSTP